MSLDKIVTVLCVVALLVGVALKLPDLAWAAFWVWFVVVAF